MAKILPIVSRDETVHQNLRCFVTRNAIFLKEKGKKEKGKKGFGEWVMVIGGLRRIRNYWSTA
ncbi:hypothetical protein BH695_0187 [Microcystis aeruginosa PCC 7806SL]|uniref:Uncharacterized protein n=1 Tax=Microcystis aeruginosa PCC 7806SL TaxID=1903187 RepID=A0AB33BIM2_MICA7|nr:hypothetical protein BH695_0187 [Microcystis aeruginosa PCC 7806SL]